MPHEARKSLKVLQLLSNPSIGGTESFVLGLIPRLRQHEIDAHLVNLWPGGGALCRRAVELGIPSHSFAGMGPGDVEGL